MDFKKPCQHLVLAMFFLSNGKYMYFAPFLENTKVQPEAPIISATQYATKNSPWIALYNATCIGVVTIPQRQLFTVDYSTICTPIQNLLTNFITRVGKPRKYKLLILPKLTKLGVTMFAERYWLRIRPYWVPNLTLYREGCQNLVFPAL